MATLAWPCDWKPSHHAHASVGMPPGMRCTRWLGLIAGWVVAFGVHALRADAAPDAPVEIIVSAASSLTDAFEALGREFERLHPDIGVAWNFSGSNHLQRQIEAVAGRGVDVFAPAGEEPMMALVTGPSTWLHAWRLRDLIISAARPRCPACANQGPRYERRDEPRPTLCPDVAIRA